ncbi:hypothetical protein SAMN04487910_1121 [Aquimarina amphilecti]|uniref:Uncharacterized protein n=1 Tax=Aquimarina amphilecti TaxID=1038014 RepID=A0A1H7JW05_AQUAM|nr:hypothetical protein [Aquimarina amphilecti]SEK78798.1 hypothetical protein SAMN04487910_1121 [Aquimarina amphilecti]
MESVICKQERALKARILTTIVLVVSIAGLFLTSEPLQVRVLFLIGALLVFGFSVSYKINKNFINQKLFSVFGIVLFEINLELEFPNYVSVYSGSFSVSNEWGAVSGIGTKERHEKFAVRFFTDNRKVTVYKTNKYKNAFSIANSLSELLDVEIYDATKL